jgi:D-glycero-D-manno-heptose 1,7-bisphosphate phosphatase
MTAKLIILIGLQASTKSSAAREIQTNIPNSIILSQDTEKGTIESLLSKVEKNIKEGKIVVIDNTNLTKKTRKLFIDLAKKYSIKVDGQYFKTTIEDCQIRHLKRMYEKFGEIYQTGASSKHKNDPHCFGSVVLFKARKDLEEPVLDEGFNRLIMRDVPEITWDPHIFKNKALFLDIDGTVRVTDNLEYKYPTKPDEVNLIRPANEIYKKLESYRKRGFKLIGVSNQSGISRGILTDKQVDEIFDKTRILIGYTEEEFPILYCPHRAAPITCFCRKPQSGMAMDCIMKLQLNPELCLMVGDMKTDEQMAKRLKIPYVYVDKFW